MPSLVRYPMRCGCWHVRDVRLSHGLSPIRLCIRLPFEQPGARSPATYTVCTHTACASAGPPSVRTDVRLIVTELLHSLLLSRLEQTAGAFFVCVPHEYIIVWVGCPVSRSERSSRICDTRWTDTL